MSRLDLSRHEFDDFVGKTIDLNGATYELLPMIDEGGEAYVFPLRNVQTRCSLFVAKIHKFRTGSAELEELRERHGLGLNLFFSQNKSTLLLATEFFEIPGGGMRFEEHWTSPDAQVVFAVRDLVMRRVRKRDLNGAWQVLKSVLAENPLDTHALVNGSNLLLRLGRWSEALSLAMTAVETEPNWMPCYDQVAAVLCATGHYQAALNVFEHAARLRPHNAMIWHGRWKVAVQFDCVHLLDAWLNEVRGHFSSENISRYEHAILNCRRHRERYEKLVAIALNHQRARRWKRAKRVMRRAIEASRDNVSARVNYAICRFRAGDGSACLDDLVPLSALADGAIWEPSVRLMCFLCARDGSRLSRAMAVSLLTECDFTDYGLPGIPILWKGNILAEEIGLDSIIAALERATQDLNDPKLSELLAQYRADAEASPPS